MNSKKKFLNLLRLFSFFELAILVCIFFMDLPYLLGSRLHNFPANTYNSLCSWLNICVMVVTFSFLFFVLLDLGFEKTGKSYSVFISRKEFILKKKNVKKVFVGRIVGKLLLFTLGVLLFYIILVKIRALESPIVSNSQLLLDIKEIKSEWSIEFKERMIFLGILLYSTFIIDILVDFFIYKRKNRYI